MRMEMGNVSKLCIWYIDIYYKNHRINVISKYYIHNYITCNRRVDINVYFVYLWNQRLLLVIICIPELYEYIGDTYEYLVNNTWN